MKRRFTLALISIHFLLGIECVCQSTYLGGLPGYQYGNIIKCGSYHFVSAWDRLYRNNSDHTEWELIHHWPNNRTFWNLKANGDTLFAFISDDHLYFSLDFGESFNMHQPNVAVGAPSEFFQSNDSIIYYSGSLGMSVSYDGGKNYNQKFTHTSQGGPAAYIDNHGIYLYGLDDTKLYRSNDHFRTSESSFPPELASITPVCLETIDGKFVLGSLYSCYIYTSSDYGISWDSVLIDSLVASVYDFYKDATGLWAGTNIGLFKSNHDGSIWTKVPYDNEEDSWPKGGPHTYDVYSIGDTMYVSLYHSVIYRSLNGGLTWEPYYKGIVDHEYLDLNSDGFYLNANSNYGAFIRDVVTGEWQLRRSKILNIDPWNYWPYYYWVIKGTHQYLYHHGLNQSFDEGNTWEHLNNLQTYSLICQHDTLWYSYYRTIYYSVNDGHNWNILGNYQQEIYGEIRALFRNNGVLTLLTYDESSGDDVFVYTISGLYSNPILKESGEAFLIPHQLAGGDSIIIANGFSDGIPISIDTGRTWTLLPLPHGLFTYGVAYKNGHVIVATSKGLWVYSVKYQTWIESEPAIFGGKKIADITEHKGDIYVFVENLGIYKLDLHSAFCLLDPNRVDCGKVFGGMFATSSDNCEIDSLVKPMFGQLIEISPGPQYSFIQEHGQFVLPLDEGNYTVKPLTQSIPYGELICPDTGLYNVVISSSSLAAGPLNFIWKIIPNVRDLDINIIPVTPTRFFDYFRVAIWVKNVGTTSLRPYLEFVFPKELSFINSSMDPASESDTLLTWSMDTLKPIDQHAISLLFRTGGSTELGDTVYFYATAYPILQDTTPINNTDTLASVIIGAFDPNDKLVDPAGTGSDGSIPKSISKFTYLIRFQNTGTDTAFNVIITDTLDPIFDLTSVQILSAQPENVVAKITERTLKFEFPNIHLPDSSVDYFNSQGYVQFSIKPKEPLNEGDKIQNQAHIFFDFNPPVATNTTLNTVETLLSSEFQHPSYYNLSVFPNPSNGTVYINLTGLPGNGILSIFNESGQLISDIDFEDGRSILEVTLPSHSISNAYFLTYSLDRKPIAISKIISIR